MSELRLVLMGKTGSGKSSTGNTILDKRVFKCFASPSSVTNTCEKNEVIVNDKKTVVVDTPGFFDTHVPQEVITQEISRCVSMTTPGPHAFLFVIGIGRFTKEEIDTVKLFLRHFGQDVEEYMIIVFTRANDLEESLDDYLAKAPEYLSELLMSCKRRYVAIDNKYKREGQVQDLMKLINKTVRKNGGKCYTNMMYEENRKMLQKKEKEIREQQAEEERKKIKEIEDKVTEKFNIRIMEHEMKSQKLELQLTDYQNRIDLMQETMSEKSEAYKELTAKIDKIQEQKEQQLQQYHKHMQEMQEEINRTKETQIQQLQEQHKQQMESQMKQFQQLQMEQLESQRKQLHEEQIEKLAKQMKEMHEEQIKNLESQGELLKNQHNQQLEKERKDWEEEHAEQMKVQRQQLEKAYRQKMEEEKRKNSSDCMII